MSHFCTSCYSAPLGEERKEKPHLCMSHMVQSMGKKVEAYSPENMVYYIYFELFLFVGLLMLVFISFKHSVSKVFSPFEVEPFSSSGF